MTYYLEKEAGVWGLGGKILYNTGKYLVGMPAYHLGVKPLAKVLGYTGKTGAKVGLGVASRGAGNVVKNIVKHPVTMLGSGALLYSQKDNIKDQLSGKRYQRLVSPGTADGMPYEQSYDQQFGRRIDPFQYSGIQQMEKTFSERLPSMSQLEKLAGVESGFPWSKVGLGVLGGIGTGLAMPTLQTLGQKIQRKLFGATGTGEAISEYNKARAKTLAQMEAIHDLRNEDVSNKKKNVLPAMNSIYDALRTSDKEIREAHKDTELRNVMHHTMNTVSGFAPDIATDPRALQSILREAVSSPEGGLSFQTIKQLSETQKFINEARNKKWAG